MCGLRPNRRPRVINLPIGRARGLAAGIVSGWWRRTAMQSRRGFLIKFATGAAVMGLVVGTVIADELLGVISKVDVEGKKITVIEKDTDKEIEIKVTEDTEVSGKGGYQKVDLEKLEKKVAKAVDAGKKGISAKIIHEKNVASKIEIKFQKKKAAQ
jgi:hypothetical protein